MKKVLALMLALLFVVALFAGCAGNTTGGSTGGGAETGNTGSANTGSGSTTETNTGSNTQTETTQPAGTEEIAPPAEEGPYNLAPGKYAVDANGYAAEKYDYELPLSTTDEVFTLWTVCWTPQVIPEEGYGSMVYPTFLRESTGVNIEYDLTTSDQRQATFSVLIAADDLRDIMAGAVSFYSGTIRNGIEDGWFVNLHDYKDYIPNYIYETLSRNNPLTTSRVFYADDIIPCFYNMYADALPDTGMCIRADLAEKAGYDWTAIDTIPELHDALAAMQTVGVANPLEIFSTIELTPGYSFSGFNTSCCVNKYGLPYAKRDDSGKVTFTMLTEDDRNLMSTLSAWYAEGLIDPNWGANDNTTLMSSQLSSDVAGVCILNPGEVTGWEGTNPNPDARWEAMPRFKLDENSRIKYGQTSRDFCYGSWSISQKCANIELLASYCDWLYSDYGSFITSYGPQGYTWDYNADGDIRLTDFVLKNPELGSAWCQQVYSLNSLADAGMEIIIRKYAFEGGERLTQMHYTWIVDGYQGEYDVPTLTFTDEQDNELHEYTNDIMTYINETYLAFLDGSSPMSEWDAYVEHAWGMGLTRCQEIYQDAYDAFMARFS